MISKLAKDALWRRGVIAAHYLLPHQQELYELIKNTSNDIVVPNISRRFGKTTTCVVYAMEECLKKKQKIRYGTAYLTDLQEFLKPICDQVLDTCPEDIRPIYHASSKTYRFKNGSELKLIGLDKNSNALRGNAIDLMIIDESAFISNLKYLYQSIIIPATANRKFKILFPSTPPEEAEHFWLELVAIAKENNTYIVKTIEDNLTINEEERQRLFKASGGESSVTVQREYFCRIVRDENTICVPEYSTDCVTNIQLPEYYYPQLTIDFGGSMDKYGIILHTYDYFKKKMLILESILVPQNTPTQTIKKLVNDLETKWYANINKHYQTDRIADCAGQTRIDMATQGLSTRAPEKGKDSMKANILALRQAFYSGDILINENLNIDLCATLELAQWKDNKEDFKRTERLGHADLLAALAYAYREHNKGNPFPSWHIVNEKPKFGKDRQKDKPKNFLLPNL